MTQRTNDLRTALAPFTQELENLGSIISSVHKNVSHTTERSSNTGEDFSLSILDDHAVKEVENQIASPDPTADLGPSASPTENVSDTSHPLLATDTEDQTDEGSKYGRGPTYSSNSNIVDDMP